MSAVCRAFRRGRNQLSSNPCAPAITANWRCEHLAPNSSKRREITIAGGQKLTAIEAGIPGDISSAAFFLCAAALFPGSKLIIDHLLMNPTRARLLDILI